MKHILTSVFLVVLLFPALALGGEVKLEDLVERDGLFYKKFTDVPFTGKVTGKIQGTFRNGKKHGPFVRYHDNGQLKGKETYKDGKLEGLWEKFYENGQLRSRQNYKNGKLDGLSEWFYTNGRGRQKCYKNDENVDMSYCED